MKPPLVLFLLLGLTATAADAAVYRCSVSGKTIYTDVPCQPGATPAQLPGVTPIQPQSTQSPLVRQFDAEAKRDAASKRKADADWQADYAARKAREETVRSAVIEHRVVKGMTMAEVRQSLGEPTRIDGEGSPSERWIYQNGRDRRTLAFTAGELKSDRASTSRR